MLFSFLFITVSILVVFMLSLQQVAARNRRSLSYYGKSPVGDAIISMLSSPRDFWGDIEEIFSSSPVPFSQQQSSTNYFPIDTKEDKESFTVICDLPGVEKKNIKLTVEQNQLTISAVKQETLKDDEGGESVVCRRRERPAGELKRTLVLPDNILKDKIEAESKDGVLVIKIPKKEKTVHTVLVK